MRSGSICEMRAVSASGPPSVPPTVSEPNRPSETAGRPVGAHLLLVGRCQKKILELRPDPRPAHLGAEPVREEGVDAGRGIALCLRRRSRLASPSAPNVPSRQSLALNPAPAIARSFAPSAWKPIVNESVRPMLWTAVPIARPYSTLVPLDVRSSPATYE